MYSFHPKIAIIGLGYVGLPLALAFAARFKGTVGFDVDSKKVERLQNGEDVNDEGYEEALKKTTLIMTAESEVLRSCNFFVVCVPTPVDQNRSPDLTAMLKACGTVGNVMPQGSIVVFESTVYPGVTEDICGPVLEQVSKFVRGKDFFLGYSPERINPGDREHGLESVIKVVSGEDPQTLEKVASVYGSVVTAGVHKAPSIKVAEAAKVIENTQRDLNIALMNELAIIFDKMGISTRDVLDAAATKWNFLRFSPGLVGGHCIGVDPYYLTTKAEQLGYHPEVILAGRRINDTMGVYVAQRVIKLMVKSGIAVRGARIGVLGLTFKENVSDLRNSRVPDIVRELVDFGASVMVHDPFADQHAAKEEYNLQLSPFHDFVELDAIILAVAHDFYRTMDITKLLGTVRPGGIVADVKSAWSAKMMPDSIVYWSL